MNCYAATLLLLLAPPMDEAYWRGRAEVEIHLRMKAGPVRPVDPVVPPHTECGCEGTKRSGDGLGPCPCVASGGECKCRRKGSLPPSVAPLELPKVRRQDTRVMVFTAKWCGPCQSQKAMLAKMGWSMGGGPDNQIQVVDIDEDKALARRYAVTSLPTLVGIVNGREARRHVGFVADPWGVSALVGIAKPREVRQAARETVRTGGHWTFPGTTAGDLRQHLIRTHGYSAAQVSGMSFEQLLNAHDDSHERR